MDPKTKNTRDKVVALLDTELTVEQVVEAVLALWRLDRTVREYEAAKQEVKQLKKAGYRLPPYVQKGTLR
jgi:hypothetical protein